MDIAACGLPFDQRSAKVGIHSFSGNDYLSSFFRKGRKTCWKKLCQNANFISAFASLGSDTILILKFLKLLEGMFAFYMDGLN